MLKHFIKAIEQLDDRAFRAVLVRGLASAFIAFIAAGFAARYGLRMVDARFFNMPDWLTDASALVLSIAAGWLFFPAIATGIMSLFLDDVVDAVEDKHYPRNRAPNPMRLSTAAWAALKLLALVVSVNVVLIPIYLALLLTAIGPVILFAAVNGYLLGREYFEMVALRHMPARAAIRLRKANRRRIWLLGLGVTGLFMVPIVNLFAPLIGAAAAVHCFHRLQHRG